MFQVWFYLFRKTPAWRGTSRVTEMLLLVWTSILTWSNWVSCHVQWRIWCLLGKRFRLFFLVSGYHQIGHPLNEFLTKKLSFMEKTKSCEISIRIYTVTIMPLFKINKYYLIYSLISILYLLLTYPSLLMDQLKYFTCIIDQLQCFFLFSERFNGFKLDGVSFQTTHESLQICRT